MGMRRVVTGHDDDGKAVFADDREVEPATLTLVPGAEYYRLWGGNETPSFPDDGSLPASDPFFPPLGGYRFVIFTVPPGHRQEAGAGPTPEELADGLAEMDAALPGMADHMEPDAPGMHTTASVDFEIVLDGEIWLELDDGAEVHLKPGDAVVQNGTRHAWRNKGTTP
ncbi:MAG: cupin domain-containing protein, partial [Desertimonas sp.]